MTRPRTGKPRVRPNRTRRRRNGWTDAIAVVRTELQTCTDQLDALRRTVTGLRAEVDHLREKIRG